MPFGFKYEEPDELDFLQKAEILHLMNPRQFEHRVVVYSRVIRILQYFGYKRSGLTGVHMMKDNQPNVIFFKINKFSAAALSDIPNYIQFAIYVSLTLNMSPDVPNPFNFRKAIVDILKQTSIKVHRRVHRNLFKFLYWCEYENDAGNYIHKNYPHLINGVLDLDKLPVHIQLALYGYFVLPKLRGQQLRMGVINAKKKKNAYDRRVAKYMEAVKKHHEELEADIARLDREQEETAQELAALDASGF